MGFALFLNHFDPVGQYPWKHLVLVPLTSFFRNYFTLVAWHETGLAWFTSSFLAGEQQHVSALLPAFSSSCSLSCKHLTLLFLKARNIIKSRHDLRSLGPEVHVQCWWMGGINTNPDDPTYACCDSGLGVPSWASLWLSAKESACQSRRHSFDPWVGKIPRKRKQPSIPPSCLEIPWTEEPGGLRSIGSQRVGHDRVKKQKQVATRLLLSPPESRLCVCVVCLLGVSGRIADWDVS